jgi:hypothetical protein
MIYSVVSKKILGKYRITSEDTSKYFIAENGEMKYCALIIKGNSFPLVYDHCYDDEINKYIWFYRGNYAANEKVNYQHQFIAHLAQIPNFQNTNLSVDHINRIKIDNRVKNLRMATQSEQNSNRDTRSDKKMPNEELINAGITELPRYVRWDNSEKKFVVEKHPHLTQEVRDGKRKKAQVSGSKSAKLSLIEKYQDILARLEELDMNLYDQDFKELIIANKKEYDDICKCIRDYEIKESSNISPVDSIVIDPIITIAATRNTLPGRKTVSKLPEGCGVKVEDIPKYCYYSPSTATRSDKFVIDKHPNLKDIRQWSTTGSSLKTTLEKFNMLIDKLQELEG